MICLQKNAEDTCSKNRVTEQCPACGSNSWTAAPVYAPQTISAKCNRCGLLRTNRSLISQDVQSLYNETSIPYILEIDDIYGAFYKYHAHRLKFILNRIPNKNLLTIGCGLGSDIKAAQQFGFNVSAVEKSKYAVRFLKERFKINIAEDIASIQLIDNEKFGLIYMSHVFEHLENPRDIINKLLPLAEKGCYFIIIVPNPYSWLSRILKGNWAGWRAEEHYFHFSKKALRILLEDCSLKVTHIFTDSRLMTYYPTVWYGQEEAKNTFTYKLISVLHKGIRVRLLAYGEKIFNFVSRTFNAADEFIVYAKK